MIVKIGDNDVTLRVDGHELRPRQLRRLASTTAELLDELAARLEDKNARLFAVDHNQMAGPINGHAFWTYNFFQLCFHSKSRGRFFGLRLGLSASLFPTHVVSKWYSSYLSNQNNRLCNLPVGC